MFILWDKIFEGTEFECWLYDFSLRVYEILTPKNNTFVLTTPNTMDPVWTTSEMSFQHLSILTPGGFPLSLKAEIELRQCPLVFILFLRKTDHFYSLTTSYTHNFPKENPCAQLCWVPPDWTLLLLRDVDDAGKCLQNCAVKKELPGLRMQWSSKSHKPNLWVIKTNVWHRTGRHMKTISYLEFLFYSLPTIWNLDISEAISICDKVRPVISHQHRTRRITI